MSCVCCTFRAIIRLYDGSIMSLFFYILLSSHHCSRSVCVILVICIMKLKYQNCFGLQTFLLSPYISIIWTDLPSVPPVCVLGKDEARGQLDNALQDVNVRYAVLEDTEKRAVCRALIEERARYCSFVSMLKPVLVSCVCVSVCERGIQNKTFSDFSNLAK